MAEEEKVIEETQTTEQPAPAEKEEIEEVDYQKELEKATAEAEANEKARQGYALRHKKEESDQTNEYVSDEEKEDRLADKVVKKLTPIIQSTVDASSFDKKLGELANGNPALSQLIKLHFDKSTNPELPTNDRLEAAYAIANKRVIAKQIAEINIAQKNRQQIVSVGTGSSTETHQTPGSNALSDAQKIELKKRAEYLGKAVGWNEATKKKFIDDAEKQLATKK
jgi:hypothetical protein